MFVYGGKCTDSGATMEIKFHRFTVMDNLSSTSRQEPTHFQYIKYNTSGMEQSGQTEKCFLHHVDHGLHFSQSRSVSVNRYNSRSVMSHLLPYWLLKQSFTQFLCPYPLAWLVLIFCHGRCLLEPKSFCHEVSGM
jgi:hypothetical protein